MIRKLYEIAADIVEAQASFAQMSPESLEQALSTVFVTLQRMKMAEDGGFLLDTAKPSEQFVEEGPGKIDPKGSIQEDKVTCLECGAKMRQLTGRHLHIKLRDTLLGRQGRTIYMSTDMTRLKTPTFGIIQRMEWKCRL